MTEEEKPSYDELAAVLEDQRQINKHLRINCDLEIACTARDILLSTVTDGYAGPEERAEISRQCALIIHGQKPEAE